MYKKIKTHTYNLHVINTDKFKTNTIEINFKRQFTKEDITYRNLLVELLFEGSKKYPTKREIEIATEDLYDLKYGVNNYISGKYLVMCFDITFLNDSYSEENNFEKSLKFICEILFNPLKESTYNAVRFKKEIFDIAYKRLEEQIKSIKEMPALYSRVRAMEIMEPNSIHSYRPMGDLEVLKTITPAKLYKYYQELINKDILDIFVIGNVDYKKVSKLVNENIRINTIKKKSESHFASMHIRRLKAKTVCEKTNNSQSSLVMGYKFLKTTPFERRYVMNVLSFILGGGPDSKLFKEVREKNSLCYSVRSNTLPLNNGMLVSAGIDKANFKKCVTLIKKNVSDIKKGKFSKEDILKAKVTYVNSIKELEDNAQNILSMYTGIEYLGSDDIPNRIKNINKVTKKSIEKLASKLHLDVIYLLEGDKDEN